MPGRIRTAIVKLAAAALTFGPAGTAIAKEPTKTPDIVVKGERPEDRKVCKTEVMTGSIMPHRVCKTQGQIDTEREESLIAAEQLRQDFETQREIRAICGTTKGCAPAL